ncbi:MAG: CHASE2 domain-containing protein [Bacteroidia bacterium]
MAEKHPKLLIRDAFLSTAFVFACIGIFASNPFNFHLFNIIGDSFKDIEITDIIYSGKNPKNSEIEAKISNKIVLINAADRSRGEIAALINKINLEKPAVLGVDFLFEGPKNFMDDSLLKVALNNTPKLVIASKFKNGSDHHSPEKQKDKYFSTWPGLGNHTEGFANLMVPSMDQTVRYFRTKDTIDKKTIHPFALEVVKQFDAKKAEAFAKRNKPFELINYEGNLNALYHYNGNDIESDNFPKGFLKNKIVLLGFFGSDCNGSPVLDDYFYTPLSEKMTGRRPPDAYGIVIQANIVNMILKQDYVSKTPAWLDWVFGFFICFLHNFIFIRHYVHKHLWYHFYAKMIQLVTSIILIFVCIYLFKQFHIKLSASPIIVPILLTVDLLYFYDTLVKWLHKKYNTTTYFLTGPLHH